MTLKKKDPVEQPALEPVVVGAAPVEEPKAAAPVVEEAKEVASDWPKFLRSATGFGYCDPNTQIRYGATPVRVDAAPKKGSWLDCQLKAKYIVPA